MLFDNDKYWLANSDYTMAVSIEVWNGVFWVNEGKVEGRDTESWRYGPEGAEYADVRPVVVLKPDVRVTTSGELYVEA